MRHPIRLVTFLLGIWFGCLLAIGVTIPATFRLIDETLAAPVPEAKVLIDELGPARARLLLRHQIAEINRRLFHYWGWGQLILGGALVGILIFATPVGRVSIGLALLMFGMSAWMKVWLIPRIEDLSRLMDFRTPGQGNGVSEEFRSLHMVFGSFEGAVLVLGLVLLLRFLHHTKSRRAGAGAPTAREQAMADELNPTRLGLPRM